jgi:hypothetical protein
LRGGGDLPQIQLHPDISVLIAKKHHIPELCQAKVHDSKIPKFPETHTIGQCRNTGVFHTVWKRQEEGSWKFVRN